MTPEELTEFKKIQKQIREAVGSSSNKECFN